MRFSSSVFFHESIVPVHHKLRVMISGNCATSGYRYPEIATKKTCFREYLRKNEKIFENILGGYSRAYVLMIHEKNQSSKISCYCPFNLCVLLFMVDMSRIKTQTSFWFWLYLYNFFLLTFTIDSQHTFKQKTDKYYVFAYFV